MKQKHPVFFAAAISLIVVLAQATNACSCRFGGGAPCEDYWRADAVFSGLAISSSQITVDRGSYKIFKVPILMFRQSMDLGRSNWSCLLHDNLLVSSPSLDALVPD
jgi:hypothetical protein